MNGTTKIPKQRGQAIAVKAFKEQTSIEDLIIIREALGHLQFNCLNQLEDATPLTYNKIYNKLQKTNKVLNYLNKIL